MLDLIEVANACVRVVTPWQAFPSVTPMSLPQYARLVHEAHERHYGDARRRPKDPWSSGYDPELQAHILEYGGTDGHLAIGLFEHDNGLQALLVSCYTGNRRRAVPSWLCALYWEWSPGGARGLLRSSDPVGDTNHYDPRIIPLMPHRLAYLFKLLREMPALEAALVRSEAVEDLLAVRDRFERAPTHAVTEEAGDAGS